VQFLSLECRVSFPVWGLAVLFGLCSDGLSPLKLRSRFLSTRPWRGLQTGRPFGPPLPRSAQTKNATNPPLRRGKGPLRVGSGSGSGKARTQHKVAVVVAV
jgi:hypothetical protein